MFLVIVYAGSIYADDSRHSHVSKYSGQQTREIKSLSATDIAILERGGGWGFAKAAELNGMPGPAHILEFKKELGLEKVQVDKVTKIFGDMRMKAVKQGKIFIDLERELEAMFRNKTVTDEMLKFTLDKIAEARKKLRYVHLNAHLEVVGILTPAQVKHYNVLRGYTDKKVETMDVRGSHHGHGREH